MGAGSSMDDSFHIESHATLLQQPVHVVAAQRTLDAIIVPTIRPQSLQAAAGLANEIGCALVVLCSTPEQAREAASERGPIVGDMLASHMPESADDGLLSFLTSVHPENDVERSSHGDIARKRNAGLLLARLCGWHTVMFLDDDIRNLTAGAVARASALTAHFQAAGFRIEDYPDNSVVCHAHRLGGGEQSVFPGGSALVIDVDRCDTLFPAIYNEDWLFMLEAVQSQSVAVAGTLSQLEYRPFAQPRRAAAEEFGDLIAEGLYRLLHGGADVDDATCEYWQGAIERRFRLIDHAAEQLLLKDTGAAVTASALMSLAAARRRLTAISPLACLSFLRAWRTDLDVWRHRLLNLPVVDDLPDAAKYLDLPTQTGV